MSEKREPARAGEAGSAAMRAADDYLRVADIALGAAMEAVAAGDIAAAMKELRTVSAQATRASDRLRVAHDLSSRGEPRTGG